MAFTFPNQILPSDVAGKTIKAIHKVDGDAVQEFTDGTWAHSEFYGSWHVTATINDLIHAKLITQAAAARYHAYCAELDNVKKIRDAKVAVAEMAWKLPRERARLRKLLADHPKANRKFRAKIHDDGNGITFYDDAEGVGVQQILTPGRY